MNVQSAKDLPKSLRKPIVYEATERMTTMIAKEVS
jgi:hypothetical protein